jgi:hypothetical protein
VIQDSFILAKAKGGAEIAADSIEHLRRYIEMLFGVGTEQAKHLTERDSKHEKGQDHRTNLFGRRDPSARRT